jgi:hypothetical protein
MPDAIFRLTGAIPDRQQSRERDRVDFNFADQTSYAGVRIGNDAFTQPMAWLRDQPVFPDCTGESVCAYVDSTLAGPPWASAVSIWRDARRRQGKIEQIDIGTRIEYAIESLVSRGWDPYRPGEEHDEVEAGKGAPLAGDDIDDEMFAYDKMLPDGLARYRILGLGSTVLDAVDEALRRGFGVILGTFLAPPFLSYVGSSADPLVVLGREFFSGYANGHAMRVRGRMVVAGRRIYLIQNSWSRAWGGCHGPDGTWQPGCVWVDETAIVGALDIHVVQVPRVAIAV